MFCKRIREPFLLRCDTIEIPFRHIDSTTGFPYKIIAVMTK